MTAQINRITQQRGQDMQFKDKYGEWTVVVGASMGIGAAIAREVASRGVNVVAVARSGDKLAGVCSDIESSYGVKAKPVALDILSQGAWDALDKELDGLEVGSAVLSAATAFVGGFLACPEDLEQRIMELNVRGSLEFSKYFGNRFCKQKRGGMLYLGSLSGYFSTPFMALYSASKGFEVMLAESLYGEFKHLGVDVTVGIIGSVDTPGLKGLYPDEAAYEAMQPAPPEVIASECVAALGSGPIIVTTKAMRRNVAMMRKLMSLNKQIEMTSVATIKASYKGQLPEQFPSGRWTKE
jgi:short-subunit dehydrogenase